VAAESQQQAETPQGYRAARANRKCRSKRMRKRFAAVFTSSLVAAAVQTRRLVAAICRISLVLTSDASISASTRIKTCPFSCACAYACVCFRCVKTEHFACAYACVASENQAIVGLGLRAWTNDKCLVTKHHQTLFGDQTF